MTQDDLAEVLGVSQVSVSRYWTTTEPRLDVLATAEEHMRLPRGYLLRAAGYVDELTTPRKAIEADPALLPGWRRVVLRAYDDAVLGSSHERSSSESKPPTAARTRRS